MKSVSKYSSRDWTKISYQFLNCKNNLLELKEIKVHFRRQIEFSENWENFNYAK
jgi:hypothetical protein